MFRLYHDEIYVMRHTYRNFNFWQVFVVVVICIFAKIHSGFPFMKNNDNMFCCIMITQGSFLLVDMNIRSMTFNLVIFLIWWMVQFLRHKLFTVTPKTLTKLCDTNKISFCMLKFSLCISKYWTRNSLF